MTRFPGAQLRFAIDVALGAHAAVQMDRPGQPLVQRGAHDRAHRRQPGAAGDGHDRAGVLLTQVRGAERAADAHQVADLHAVADPAAHPAGQHADVELELRLARRAGHGIVARRVGGEGELQLGELTGGEGVGAARLDREAQHQHIVREHLAGADPALQHARGMHDEVLGGEAPDLHVAPHLRAAGEHDVAGALRGRQGVLGVLQLEDLAGDVLALAGAAVARLAAVGEAHPVAQQRGEDGLAVLRRHRLGIARDGDGMRHAHARPVAAARPGSDAGASGRGPIRLGLAPMVPQLLEFKQIAA
jgi:hypothetical protein